MEPQSEPRRRRKPVQPVISEEPEQRIVKKNDVKDTAQNNEHIQSFVPDHLSSENTKPVKDEHAKSSGKKKKNRPKRPVLLLLFSLYALFCAFYILMTSAGDPETTETGVICQWVFCILSFLVGTVGYVFNSQILALIAASTILVSIVLNIPNVFLIAPAVIMGFASYAMMYIATQKVEKAKQREIEEEEMRNFRFRQGEHVMNLPPQAMQQAQQYGSQPIIINVQNSNTNTVNGNKDEYNYKSKAKTFVIALLFGLLGFHRFYVGKNLTGILYFLTGGLLGIGWIVDCVLILTGAFKDSEGKPLK